MLIVKVMNPMAKLNRAPYYERVMNDIKNYVQNSAHFDSDFIPVVFLLGKNNVIRIDKYLKTALYKRTLMCIDKLSPQQLSQLCLYMLYFDDPYNKDIEI